MLTTDGVINVCVCETAALAGIFLDPRFKDHGLNDDAVSKLFPALLS